MLPLEILTIDRLEQLDQIFIGIEQASHVFVNHILSFGLRQKWTILVADIWEFVQLASKCQPRLFWNFFDFSTVLGKNLPVA